MRHTVILLSAFAGCSSEPVRQPQSSQVSVTAQATTPKAAQRNPAKPQQAGFLGLPDNASRKIGDDSPDSAYKSIPTISEVQLRTYDDYLADKKFGRISTEEVRGDYLYYAALGGLHAGNGYFFVTFRYKAKLPK